MISIDDDPSPDPQNHHQQQQQQQISQDLNTNSHEEAPDSVSDLDLSKSPDDTTSPLPNFSIREYVFGSRSKNGTSNWPFSQKSLQLCLKHGVKNLLPPFQSLCLRDNRLPDEELVITSCDGQFESNGAKPDHQELTLECASTNSSRESESHLEQDLAHTKSKTPPVASQKTENTTVKKNTSVVKANPGVEPVEEVSSPNNFVVSETMAAKVCPVCKTFSSSSNTTLNAHIDQCLSGESSLKWTANPNPNPSSSPSPSSKVAAKPKVKRRKKMLMGDIYKAARHCTVEELDRRNGTSWASNSNFPAQELQFQGEEEREEPKTPPINPEVADQEGAVYIDTNGTKLRILSVPKAGTSDDRGAQKSLKGSKNVAGKKKNKTPERKHHQKHLKLGPNDKTFRSPKPRGGVSEACTSREDDVAIDEQACSSREDDVAIQESCNKEDKGKQPMKAQVRMHMDDLAIVRPPWACSRRTRLAKKFSGKHGKLDLLTKDLLVESDKSSSGYGDMSSSQSSKKTETSSSFREQPVTSNGSPVEDANDIRSKGGKFSSLRKNPRSVSIEPIPATKLNLKRKFSALEKSCVNRLSNEKTVVGPSQDSSARQSGIEEDTSVRMPSERLNLSKTEKETKICGENKSITSKSSNGESSVGLETALVDPESVRNETWSSNGEQVPDPNVTDAERSFMDLSNSFDPPLSKLVCQPEDKFDSQESLRSPNRDQEKTFCADDTGKNIFGNDIEDGPDDFEMNGNYYHEVNPIPIPGPPGSFLPSPGGDMASDELQENSSLTTTSRGENQHPRDKIDRDSMSTSPVSAVSNPSLARSDSRSSDKFSVRSTSRQDDTRLGLSGAMDERSTSPVEADDWRSVNPVFAEKGPPSTGLKNHQPCCCSRKEGALNYQERKRAHSFDFGSEMSSLSNYPVSPAPGTVVFPQTMKSPAPVASGSTVQFPIHNDCESAASPKPVIRLMGKNLTVVSIDEDVSSVQQCRPPPSLMGQQPPNQQDHNAHFSHGYPPQRPVIFTQNQRGAYSHHFDVHPTFDFNSHGDSRTVHAFDRMIPGTRGGVAAPVVDGYSRVNHYLSPTASQGHNRLDARAMRLHNPITRPTNETILLRGSPENATVDAVMLNERMKRSCVSVSSSSAAIHTPTGYNDAPQHSNYPFYNTAYQPQSYDNGSGSLVFRGGSFQTGSSSVMAHQGSLGSSAVYHPPSFP